MKFWNCVWILAAISGAALAGEVTSPGRSSLIIWDFPGPTALSAPWRQLVSDYRGNRVMLVSPLTLRGEKYHDFSKIYEVDRSGLARTVASVDIEPALEPSRLRPQLSENQPLLDRPDVSSDGAVVVYGGYSFCVEGGCNSRQERAMVAGVEAGPGRARVSANGEWVVRWTPKLGLRPNAENLYELTERKSGRAWTGEAPGPVTTAGAGRRAVADDGTIVAVGYRGLELGLAVVAPGRAERWIGLSERLEEVTIDTAARFTVGRTVTAPTRLVLVDMASGEQIPVISAEEGASHPALSDDGGTLLFLSAANWNGAAEAPGVQAWSLDLTSGLLTQWTHETGGVVEATISGDGQVVWAVSGRGRLVRAERGQEAAEVLAAAPWRNQQTWDYPQWGDWSPVVAAAGGRLTLTGVGLGEARMRLGEAEFARVEAGSGAAVFASAFSTPLGTATALLENPASPFGPQRVECEIRQVAPMLLTRRDGQWAVADGVHGDGSAISQANPARPGEVIVLRATGLGPVDARNVPVQGYAVSVRPADAMLPEVPVSGALFGGASGVAGLYFVQFRVPEGLGAGWADVVLRLSGEELVAAVAMIPVALP